MRLNKQQGFTLIEVMITVAIGAILAGLAIPSYMDQVRKGKRSEAKVELLKIAQMQESYFAQNLSYANSLTQLGFAANTINSENAEYSITLTSVLPGGCTGLAAASCQSFSINATPISTSQLADSDCTRFTLTNTGLKGTSAGASADAIKKCWK